MDSLINGHFVPVYPNELSEAVTERLKETKCYSAAAIDSLLLQSKQGSLFALLRITTSEDEGAFLRLFHDDLASLRAEEPELVEQAAEFSDTRHATIEIGLEKTLVLIEDELKNVVN